MIRLIKRLFFKPRIDPFVHLPPLSHEHFAAYAHHSYENNGTGKWA